jgi:hypothetical protein
MTTSIPNQVRDVLIRLEFLSMIPQDAKPCMTFVDSKSWFGWFKRTKNSEGKKSMLLSIDKIIDSSIDVMLDYNVYKSLILNALIKAKDGLSNLIVTYSDSPSTVAALKVCMSNIDMQR